MLHHFKWRDRLLRSFSRTRANANQHEQDAYRLWLEQNGSRLPTEGLKPCSRASLFEAGHLMRPKWTELLRLAALRRSASASAEKAAGALRTLALVPMAAEQLDERALPYLDRPGLQERPGRIALVTTELLGVRVTGGIGTAMTALAERLAAGGHDVHVFLAPYVGSPKLGAEWLDYWDARGVRIHHLDRRTEDGRIVTSQELSLIVCGALLEDDWDVIHFPELDRIGALLPSCTALPVLPSKGRALRSRCTVRLAGIGAETFCPGPPMRKYPSLEAMSIDLADVLVFPSRYMLEWCRRHFPSPAPHLVVPNCLIAENWRFGRVSTARRPVEMIVFFGRVELRKGLDRFLAAIDIVIASGTTDFEVVFLGSLGQDFSDDIQANQWNSGPAAQGLSSTTPAARQSSSCEPSRALSSCPPVSITLPTPFTMPRERHPVHQFGRRRHTGIDPGRRQKPRARQRRRG